MKSAKVAKSLVGFPAPDQLSCDSHPFFEGLHPLSANAKASYNMSCDLRGPSLKVAR